VSRSANCTRPPAYTHAPIFFFLPIAAGTGRVRLPVVGIAITLLCIFAFVSTWLLADNRPDLGAWKELQSYYAQHPYLELPEAAADLPFEVPDPDITPPSAEVRRSEQAELERLFERLIERSGGAMRRYSLVPARGFLQLGWLTSFFLHFGWLHLLGNLLFLYITAPLLEDAWGRLRFLVFYVLGGLVANATQFALQPHAVVSIAGASGAIAACMGAFAVRFARSKVRMMYFIWLIRIWAGTALVPAWVCGVAWFLRELWDLKDGGAAGVATGAHVGGFALGAGVALGMRALGFEKELLTAEEAELDTAHKSDLMESASIAAARGELEVAKENLVELLKVMPGREDAEALLGEVELRLGGGGARFERHLRKLMQRNDAELAGTVLRVWQHVDVSRFSSPFCLQLAKHLQGLKNPRLEPLFEPLLRQAGAAGGRLKTMADELLASLGTQTKREALSLELEPQDEAPAVTEVRFGAVSREGITLTSGETQRVVPFGEVLAVHVGVAPVGARRVLLVDLVVRKAPPQALRLTSDDPGVPALFPGTPVPQAWRTFVTKLINTSKAQALPPGEREGVATFDSPAAVTASWAAWARG